MLEKEWEKLKSRSSSKKRAQRNCIRFWYCIFEKDKTRNEENEFSNIERVFYQTKVVKENMHLIKKREKKSQSLTTLWDKEKEGTC